MRPTTTTDSPVYVPTLDEIDRIARLSLPPGLAIEDLAPQARLLARIAARQEIIARREEVRS